MEIVKIPRERINTLSGPNGETRKMFEKRLKLAIKIGDDGEVELSGESVDEFFGKDVIKAIGRGFASETALKLLKDDYCLRVIDLRQYCGSDNAITRIKGRIIGEQGRTKHVIEAGAESELSIYGHTVSVVGPLETIDIAVNSIFKLIDGSNHSTVYAYIEHARHNLKEERVKNMF